MDHTAFLASLPPTTRVALTRRPRWHGAIHLAAHAGAIAVTGVLIARQVPAWPLLLPVQGVLLVFVFTLQHECTHRTPFASDAVCDGVGHVAGALLLNPFVWFRYFHLAHHRHTNQPGDPELTSAKPETRAQWFMHVSGVPVWMASVGLLFRLARGRETPPFLPLRQIRPAQTEARVLLAVYAVAALTLVWSPMVLWVWVVPVLLGQPFLRLYLLAEHGDCPQVADMFANTRTTFTSKLVRFLAWNMPFHVEHHTYPAVPYDKLPVLHALLRDHLKVTADGYLAFSRAYLARRH